MGVLLSTNKTEKNAQRSATMAEAAEAGSSNTTEDGTFECIEGNVLNRTGCILSYGGSTKDIILNYLVLVINLSYCVAAVANHHRVQNVQRFALGALIFVVLFQISLCLALGCSGISIIWCAMGGWTMSERRRVVETNTMDEDEEPSRSLKLVIKLGQVVILVDSAVIVYYAVVEEVITTVAHICALILGAVLSLTSIRLYDDPTAAGGPQQPLGSSRT
jgi:hypothetical protein